jgi:hypothetical protein
MYQQYKSAVVVFVILFAFGALSIGCTKPDKSDDVVKGDPPPVPGGFTNSSQVATTNLVGYWDFNGNLKDNVSGTNAVGTNISYATGLKGQAMQGAINGYAIATPSNAIKTMGAFTISFWVNSPLNTAGIAGLVNFSETTSFWGNINLFFENGGNTNLMRFKALYSSGGTVFDLGVQDITGRWNLWNHFALTYDGAGNFEVYLNGVSIKSLNRAGMAAFQFTNFGHIVFGTVHFQTTPSLTTGSTSQPWASFLTGRLDEVRIFNKALTAIEVSALTTLEKQGR